MRWELPWQFTWTAIATRRDCVEDLVADERIPEGAERLPGLGECDPWDLVDIDGLGPPVHPEVWRIGDLRGPWGVADLECCLACGDDDGPGGMGRRSVMTSMS